MLNFENYQNLFDISFPFPCVIVKTFSNQLLMYPAELLWLGCVLVPELSVPVSEIFPNSIRSLAMSIAVAAQWLFNAIVANTFPIVNDSVLNRSEFNGALSYFVFAFFCLVTVAFVWKYIPETKGKTLEEMENLWQQDSDELGVAEPKVT